MIIAAETAARAGGGAFIVAAGMYFLGAACGVWAGQATNRAFGRLACLIFGWLCVFAILAGAPLRPARLWLLVLPPAILSVAWTARRVNRSQFEDCPGEHMERRRGERRRPAALPATTEAAGDTEMYRVLAGRPGTGPVVLSREPSRGTPPMPPREPMVNHDELLEVDDGADEETIYEEFSYAGTNFEIEVAAPPAAPTTSRFRRATTVRRG